jgi:hypothetical protein
MNIAIFTGPTLSEFEASAILDAHYLPPVSQGDVYRVAREAPDAIGIIDGYFHRVPAVWHKEILWALSRGIRVFGSASMGALRAAELARFGMEGIGWVFESFHSGALEDDDEVALVHSAVPIKNRFIPYSQPMVNIRRTFARAEDEGIISQDLSTLLTQTAKNLYYGDRLYETILERVAAAGANRLQLETLRHWLPAHQVDQKREDAIAMLEAMRERLFQTQAPSPPSFRFERTELWNQLCARQTTRGGAELDSEALLRASLLKLAAHHPPPEDGMALSGTILEFRRENLLIEASDMDRWLLDRGLTGAEFLRLMEDETTVTHLKRTLTPDAERVKTDLLTLAQPAR